MGSAVPQFSAESTAGVFSLAENTDRVLVLFFYPRDNTSGCTRENEDFRDLHGEFLDKGVRVFGISRDTLASHHKFAKKLELPFPLIADPKEELCGLFDVMRDKNMYGKKVRGIERSTFLLAAGGILTKEWRKVKVPGHAAEVLASLTHAAAT